MTNIPVIYEDSNGWSEPQHTKDNKFRIVCCDCGLAHEFHFSVTNKNVSFKIRADKRLTNRVRKHDTHTYVPK